MKNFRRIAKTNKGFTIVELLIVIVVIAILAAISVVAYNGIQDRTRKSKIASDLAMLEKAIILARDSASDTLQGITNNSYTAGQCVNNGIDSPQCLGTYNTTMTRISNASGVNVTGLRDPWGRPYFIDQNERSPELQCDKDEVAAYAYPFDGNTRYPDSRRIIAMSGYTGC